MRNELLWSLDKNCQIYYKFYKVQQSNEFIVEVWTVEQTFLFALFIIFQRLFQESRTILTPATKNMESQTEVPSVMV